MDAVPWHVAQQATRVSPPLHGLAPSPDRIRVQDEPPSRYGRIPAPEAHDLENSEPLRWRICRPLVGHQGRSLGSVNFQFTPQQLSLAVGVVPLSHHR